MKNKINYKTEALGEIEMFRIAICDDNRVQCNAIENVLDEFFKTEIIKCEIDVFISGEELIFSLNSGEKYDLIYLDIELEEIDGIFVGKYIREDLQDDNTQIVYISGKTSYALDLFQVRPMHFLIKPLQRQQIVETVQKVIELQGKQTKVFLYKAGRTEKKVPFKEIMYFSSEAKKVVIHMKNGEDYFYGKLTDIVYPSDDFMCIHKSYIVNRHYVMQFKFDSIILINSVTLPISRIYREEVRDKLKKWHRKDKQ